MTDPDEDTIIEDRTNWPTYTTEQEQADAARPPEAGCETNQAE